jgi:acyl-[acyl-carrier-protein]-phospholipid O-acyltransferase/long-chain-fatty-acid--[acyl-carrier-protein] ligase
MKVYDGAGLVADKSGATVVPVRIDGAQFTPFSRLRGRVRIRWFPRITLKVLPPRRIAPPHEVTGRERRRLAGKALSDLMTEMMFAGSNTRRTLFRALLDTRRVHGGGRLVAEDVNRSPLSLDRLIAGAFVLGRRLAHGTEPAEHVGVLLPAANGTVVTFMGLQAFGRVPAMLNFTLGPQALRLACETGRIRRVITSRRFVEAGKLEPVIEALGGLAGIVYLEDVAAAVRPLDKLAGWLQGRFADLAYQAACPLRDPESTAVVLFTSGSEGTPKGVALAHRNLLANREQLAARVDFTASDIILNVLPLFHSFGLTAGTLLPLLSGMRTFFYPSPLHYRIVPEVAYDINATILFGTNTFLAGYARFAHPYDFFSVRYVFAGAEKLNEETRRTWSERYGVRIFEGYGATETSPVLATNTPMENRPGTVGRLLPGIEHWLETVPGVVDGGRLHVRGPNVMRGYLLHASPGELVPPASTHGAGWYDTGDIVSIDGDGFVTIQGRAKRFAKIGGEMISLTAVEQLVSRLWPEYGHAVLAVPDAQKGEQLVLFTEYPDAERGALLAHARASGFGELGVPRTLRIVERLPVLGTGKLDYQGIKALLESAP